MPKTFLCWLAAGIIFMIIGCTQSVNNIEHLESQINERLDGLSGDFAVAFMNLSDTSETILINEREMFHAASTMKTPVMIELYKQVDAGEFSLDDSILVKNEFRSIVDGSDYQMSVNEDSEGELYDLIGKKRTIRDLMYDMITMSSNLATNILIEKVNAENVTETMRSYGADSIMVLRGVEDIKAFEQGLSNRTTAYDEMKIYSKIGTGEAVSEEASEQMIGILEEQKFNEMIPALLPADVQVAHKTGWITGVNHDAGIITLPTGERYVLVLLSKNASDREEVLSAFSDISKMVYDFVVQ
ncbi:MAG: serine hydrolase [Gracilimonas sp.]|uniref:serine hydrolase n=1 Tax=Gracilimonas sp. TaxID=1974203 RepID=UPI00198593AB|nr:serine hydrolase [Gracilimonas sp.]MBD3616673.1 serine hydrolase [Gracilimonas sp.]